MTDRNIIEKPWLRKVLWDIFNQPWKKPKEFPIFEELLEKYGRELIESLYREWQAEQKHKGSCQPKD